MLLVIDGMGSRFSFPTFESQQTASADEPAVVEAVWQNKMKVFERLATANPNQAVHRPCKISAPTWTIDRVTSLVTGGFPSQDLKDLLKGLQGQDHLFRDLQGSQNYFIGDIVWKDLIDSRDINFSIKKYYNFFMQHSTATTDERLVGDLIEFIKQTPDFKFLLSHTAELDHHVHVDGLSSEHTGEILVKLDDLMEKLISAIDDDTLLLITSDHGLVENGHGGVSREERDSFIFAYRRNGLFGSGLQKSPEQLSAHERRSQELDYFDLTPTISLLLGNTPPLNSIGDILPDILPSVSPIQSDTAGLTRAYYLLRCRLEVFKQKYFLEQYRGSEGVGSFQDMLTNTESVLSRVEGVLFGPTDADTQSANMKDELLKEAFDVLEQGTRRIQGFKEHAESQAFVHDFKSSLWATRSLIAMVVGFIAYSHIIGNRAITMFRFGCNYKFVLLNIGSSYVMSYLLEVSVISGQLFFAALCSVAFIYIDATFKTNRSFVVFLIRFWEECRVALLQNYNGVLVYASMLTLRIMENNNAMIMGVPLQAFLIVKILVDYGCGTMFQLIKAIQSRKANLISEVFSRLGFILREVLLILLISLGDPKFFDLYLVDLGWFFNTFAQYGVIVGTLLPAIILFLLVNRELKILGIQGSNNFKILKVLFGTSMILLVWNIPILESSPFWGREFLPCVLLGLTAIQAIFIFRQPNIPLALKILILTLPIVLLIGGKYSSYNTLFNLLLVFNSFQSYRSSTLNEIGKQHYTIGNILYLSRMIASASGLRIAITDIKLASGTLFVNDYHSMSWLIVMIHTIYPYIFTFLFTEYMMFKQIKNPRSFQAARANFHSGLNVGFIGDILCGSLLFLSQSTNLMIGLATCTLVFQGQTFLTTSLLKVIFLCLD